jgi:hypothetical protein
MGPPAAREVRHEPPGPPVGLVFDIRLSAGAPRPSHEERRRIDAGVASLVALGATVLRRNQGPED